MSSAPESPTFSFLDDVHKPKHSERYLRASLMCPEGRESYLTGRDCKVTVSNHGEAARQLILLTTQEIEILKQEVVSIQRERGCTPAMIAQAVEGTHPGAAKLSVAFVLAIVAIIGATVSVTVISEYALQSASSLFAKPHTALLYATLPTFTSICIKLFEAKLSSPYSKWVYATAWYVLCLASFAAWLVSSAIALAPDLGLSLASASEPANPKLVGIVVLVSTVLTELGIGYTILSGASDILGPQHNSVKIPNPAFEALTARKDALKRELFEFRFLRIRAQNYHVRLAALREEVRLDARHDLGRAEEIFVQVQTAGLAVGIAAFFKLPEDES